MNAISREILAGWQVRKNARQKKAFRAYLSSALAADGWEVRAERSVWGTNVVAGDAERAKVIFTAHYDTCAVMPVPNFITPKAPLLYILYSLVLCMVMFLIGGGVAAIGSALGLSFGTAAMLVNLTVFALLFLLMDGPANRHTANDNTSSVIAILEAALAMPQELRGKAAFVFFDNEEKGLLGSMAFASKHPEIKKNALILNLDCVSDGHSMLFVLPASLTPAERALIAAAFPQDGERETLIEKSRGTMWPSDQANFRRGVGVAALKRTKRGLLYLDRIHTPRDTAFDEGNIAFLVRGAVELTGAL